MGTQRGELERRGGAGGGGGGERALVPGATSGGRRDRGAEGRGRARAGGIAPRGTGSTRGRTHPPGAASLGGPGSAHPAAGGTAPGAG